jgi:hypothetical protein
MDTAQQSRNQMVFSFSTAKSAKERERKREKDCWLFAMPI